jgi:hypothetical protein
MAEPTSVTLNFKAPANAIAIGAITDGLVSQRRHGSCWDETRLAAIEAAGPVDSEAVDLVAMVAEGNS